MSIRIRTLLFILAFAICAVVAGPSSALAQAQPENGTSTSSVDDRLAELTQKLNLTDDQQKKIKPILEDQQQQVQQKDNSLSPEDKMSRLRRIEVATSGRIRELLTDEQKPAFDQMEKERLDGMEWKPEKSGDSSPK